MKSNVLSLLLIFFSLTLNANPRGKIGDGGGELLPEDSVSVEAVMKVIKNYKRDLRLFIKSEQQAYANSGVALPYANSTPKNSLKIYTQPLFQKLYGDAKTLWDILESVKLDADPNTACYMEVDGKLTEVLGSYSIADKSICINVTKVAPTLVEERIQEQLLSLIIHELSHHLLGKNENEVNAYQKHSLNALRKMNDSTASLAENGYSVSKRFAEEIRYLISTLMAGPKSDSSKELSEYKDEVYKLLNILASRSFNLVDSFNGFKSGIRTNFAFHNAEEADQSLLQYIKLRNAIWYLETATYNSRSCEPYKSFFASRNGLTIRGHMDEWKESNCIRRPMDNYYRFFNIGKNDAFENILIDKIENQAQLMVQLLSLAEYYEAQAEYIRKIKENLPLP